MRKPWNEEKIKLLTEMWNENKHSASQIATALGRGFTRNSVIGKANRLKLERKRHRDNVTYGWKPPKRERPMEHQETKLARMFGALGGLTNRATAPKVTLPVLAEAPLPVSIPTPKAEGEGVSFFDAEPCQCRYIIADGESVYDLRFCGKPVEYKSWCGEHYRKCFVTSYSRRERDPHSTGSHVR
jgi:hypothetical protein